MPKEGKDLLVVIGWDKSLRVFAWGPFDDDDAARTQAANACRYGVDGVRCVRAFVLSASYTCDANVKVKA